MQKSPLLIRPRQMLQLLMLSVVTMESCVRLSLIAVLAANYGNFIVPINRDCGYQNPQLQAGRDCSNITRRNLVEMESNGEPSQRQLGLSKLLAMAQTLYRETANMTVETVGRQKLNQEEADLMHEIGNVVFLTLQQTIVGHLSKKLSRNQCAIHEVLEMKYPLQVTVSDLRRAEKKVKNEVKRLKKKSSVKPDVNE